MATSWPEEPEGLTDKARRDQRLRSFERHREAGARLYREEKFAEAVRDWGRARWDLKYLVDKGLLEHDPAALARARADLLSLCLNMAQGHLRAGAYRDAIDFAGLALTFEPRISRGDDTVGNPHRSQIYQFELSSLFSYCN